jgi:hypothetical protein
MTKFWLVLLLLAIGGCSFTTEDRKYFTIDLGLFCIPCNNTFIVGGCGGPKICEEHRGPFSETLEPDKQEVEKP